MSIEGSVEIGRPRVVPGKLLRGALALDAVVTGANAVAYIVAAPLLADWLGLPVGVLVAVGAFLALYAGGVWHVANRSSVAASVVWGVIALNVVWALDSFLLLAVDGFSPTLAGQIVVAVHAVGVLGFAALQYAGLRHS